MVIAVAWSRCNLIRLWPKQTNFWRCLASKESDKLSEESKKKLREHLPAHVVKETRTSKPVLSLNGDIDTTAEMDAIRARGFLKHTYKYDPPPNLDEIFQNVQSKFKLQSDANEKFHDLETKAKVLLELSKRLNHLVPSSKLSYLTNLTEVKHFYHTPVKNITEYAELAREKTLPSNLALLEHPIRFHPNDTEATHGGVTAYPGEGGKVLGVRNKRLYRQFRPKSEWFDYEEQTFDYEDVCSGQPWDLKIAHKMDRYTDRKFIKTGFKNMR